MSGGIIDKTTILKIEDVSVNFNVGEEIITPLKNANFNIKSNSFNIIYGPSGSGKSTLLNTIGGLQRPTSGKVNVQGYDLYRLTNDELSNFRANRIGFIHQTNYWVKSLSVLDNVAIPLYALGFSRSKSAKIAISALDRVQMTEHAHKFPSVLSGGEQQRIAMARALANDPLFLIADEPTGNLDTPAGDSIMRLLLNCQTEFRRTIILVTHNMEYIPFADHLLSIQNGVVEDISQDDTSSLTGKIIKETKNRIRELEKVKAHATRI